jgi:hypothetical protein
MEDYSLFATAIEEFESIIIKVIIFAFVWVNSFRCCFDATS